MPPQKPLVDVARKNHRHQRPVERGKQLGDLRVALAPAQTEMRRDDSQRLAAIQDIDVERAVRFAAAKRKIDRARI